MKNKKIRKWIRKHEKELKKAGITIASIVTFFTLLYYNRNSVEEIISLLNRILKNCNPKHIQKTPGNIDKLINNDIISDEIINIIDDVSKTYSSTKAPHTTHSYLRRLPVGQHASQNSINRAMESGVILESNYTFVSGYETGKKIA